MDTALPVRCYSLIKSSPQMVQLKHFVHLYIRLNSLAEVFEELSLSKVQDLRVIYATPDLIDSIQSHLTTVEFKRFQRAQKSTKKLLESSGMRTQLHTLAINSLLFPFYECCVLLHSLSGEFATHYLSTVSATPTACDRKNIIGNYYAHFNILAFFPLGLDLIASC